MDDSCAVCAETLEWVAYGGCGHKDVCSTCVVRLRFICNDRRCCICKTESNVIFVTKALGDYTRMISDLSVLPSEPKEGRVGAYWYHEDTQAFFDDSDHYKMIRAMCRLSCSVCDNYNRTEDQPNDGPKRRPRLFRNIEQLKGHLFHQHKLLMCCLCLEGRKVFICEQKLYTRAQLNQHINTGNSEVDGSESERGGFAGHPVCEFCRTPFYGDNELYSHMSTEHYTCHICQRQQPGQYEYYKNYDDLEIHFRRDHFLCEDETCLDKKFLVFQSEAELKRHNTLEHGGRMSRSQRNAALQIPTSFRYRRSNEQESRRGRGRTFRRDTSDNELLMAIQASFETANLDGRVPDSSSSAQTQSGSQEVFDVDPVISPFESLATADTELPSRYLQALSLSSRNAPLQEDSFPPLPGNNHSRAPQDAMARLSSRNAPLQEDSFPPLPGNNHSRAPQDAMARNTMAGMFRSRTRVLNKKVPVSAPVRPGASNVPVSLTVSPPRHAWPTLDGASGSASSSGQSKPATEGPLLSSYPSLVNAGASLVHESSSSSASSQSRTSGKAWPALSNSSGSASISGPSKPAFENGSAYSASLKAKPGGHESSGSSFYSSSRNRVSSKISHSVSAPNLVGDQSFDSSSTDFPPVSAAQPRKFPAVSPVVTSVEDVHTANKSLVERIRIALDFNEDRYAAFKVISGEYRQGLIDAETYLVHVEQFGLSHLVLELARLLPDPQKQKELIGIYNANLVSDGAAVSERRGAFPLKDGNGSKKGKKPLDSGCNTSKEDLADTVISTVRKLQSSYDPSEEVEVLTKEGYRTAKGKSKVMVNESQVESGTAGGDFIKPKDQTNLLSGGGSSQNLGDGDGKNKQRKKTSKFHRVRLGDNTSASILDLNNLNSDPDPDPGVKGAVSDGQNRPDEVLPVRGVWRNGGGQKLLARTSK